MKNFKVIISGGGTGGHIFPALAIADEIKHRIPNAEILFVGAKGKMEMTKVPANGYSIVGLDIQGIQRRLTLKNLWVPFKIIKSMLKAIQILKKMNPTLVIGVGGYASGPLLQAASWLGYPYIIQEQNSFPGITNKLLAPKARKIFTAYESMEMFFPKDKIILAGNPVRKSILGISSQAKDYQEFNLKADKTTILCIGGSLGALTLNESMHGMIEKLLALNCQIIWQTGKSYIEKAMHAHGKKEGVCIMPFIENMDKAYAISDIIISRAGALSVSELCIVGKPVVFVPSPNVSEDHQTKNAMALVNKNAARMVKDLDARENLYSEIKMLLLDKSLREILQQNISSLAKPNATEVIVNHILAITKS